MENPNSKQENDSKEAEFLPPPPSNGSTNTGETNGTKARTQEDSKIQLATAADDEPVQGSDPPKTVDAPGEEGVTEPENSAAQESLANDIATDVLANFHSAQSQSAGQSHEPQGEVRNMMVSVTL